MNVEAPIFDLDLHAMAMDRRPLIEQIKNIIFQLLHNKNKWLQPTTKPSRSLFPTEEPLEK